MRITTVAALLYATGLTLLCARAEQTDAARKHFLDYQAEAGQGNAKAQCDLGICYMSGLGVGKDYVEAVKWFRKAADQNHAKAQALLGASYAHEIGRAHV